MAKAGRRKGSIPWNKGLKTGLVPKTAFKKGHVPSNLDALIAYTRSVEGRKASSERLKGKVSRNKGKSFSAESRLKMSKAQKKRFTLMSSWNKGTVGMMPSGDKNNRWKGGITSKNNIQRANFRRTIQKQVLERDKYTCQLCGEVGGNLHVDHIQSWADYVELRFNINNCRTLCQSCHYKITYGKPMPPTVRAWGHNLKEVSKYFQHNTNS